MSTPTHRLFKDSAAQRCVSFTAYNCFSAESRQLLKFAKLMLQGGLSAVIATLSHKWECFDSVKLNVSPNVIHRNKNPYFPLLAVVLFIHLGCFVVSSPVVSVV